MNNCLSIIIPMYNGSVYITKAIQSVLDQTYTHIECIVIDDGSVDGSLAIVQSFCVGHDNIYVYQQENSGIAQARNSGLNHATGEYIMFMDQDDWIDPDYVEKLINQISELKADVVISGFRLVEQNGRIKQEWRLDVTKEWSKYRITAPWGRVFRKSIIDKYHIRFMNTKISEDLYFNMLFLSHTGNVIVSSYVGYNWLYNKKSESRKNWKVMSTDRDPLIMLNQLLSEMPDSNLLDQKMLHYFFTKYIIWYLLYSSHGEKYREIKDNCNRCFEWMKRQLPESTTYGKYSLFYPKGESMKVRFSVTFSVMLYRMKMLPLFLKII